MGRLLKSSVEGQPAGRGEQHEFVLRVAVGNVVEGMRRRFALILTSPPCVVDLVTGETWDVPLEGGRGWTS